MGTYSCQARGPVEKSQKSVYISMLMIHFYFFIPLQCLQSVQ